MTFLFKGFCVKTDNLSIINSATKQWNNLKVKQIQDPFKGLVIGYPNDDYREVLDYEKSNSIEKNLLDFSKEFPEEKFVFISTDCWGGYCSYYGYVCLNSIKIFEANNNDSDNQDIEDDKLSNLLKYLEIKTDERVYFRPLTRKFFDNE